MPDKLQIESLVAALEAQTDNQTMWEEGVKTLMEKLMGNTTLMKDAANLNVTPGPNRALVVSGTGYIPNDVIKTPPSGADIEVMYRGQGGVITEFEWEKLPRENNRLKARLIVTREADSTDDTSDDEEDPGDV